MVRRVGRRVGRGEREGVAELRRGAPALAWAGVLGARRPPAALEEMELRVANGCALLRRHMFALVETSLFLRPEGPRNLPVWWER